jgi:hypothetical protein
MDVEFFSLVQVSNLINYEFERLTRIYKVHPSLLGFFLFFFFFFFSFFSVSSTNILLFLSINSLSNFSVVLKVIRVNSKFFSHLC